MAKVTFKIVPAGKSFKDSGDKSTWIPEYREGQLIFVRDQ